MSIQTPPRSRDEELRDAAEARRLMESYLLKRFFEVAPDVWTKAFIQSRSPEEREKLWAEAQGIEQLRIYLQKLVDNGKHAEDEQAREDAARDSR